ncbi:hypothetical protein [Mucilaginibacter ginsenosidivorax]|uniref:Uncharacterized protein n=1 Tax=Mucilaginibacter ginsenosidivorax TaxID=862126 RepID=A0A5B8W6Y1_9SPHI|nr:hypothetical protein [Mucilaginibacter ginsenosidivorax]QEC79760.1 hypothetical protein FSB76_28795 [Mucilaginibacter ginsenosidivorax]
MMEDNDLNNPSRSGNFNGNEIPGPNKQGEGMKIVGYNILTLAIYSIPCFTVSGGALIDAFLLLIHVVVCICAALGKRSWFWLLAGLLVLIIGFSTCVTVGFKGL